MSQQLREITNKLLENELFNFSNSTIAYEFFPEFINENLKKYNTLLNEKPFWEAFLKVHYPNNPETIESLDIFLKRIENFCSNLNSCINSYYLGRVNEAFSYLKIGLEKSISWPTSLLFEEAITVTAPGDLKLYRIRRSNEEAFGKKEMFHIPFDKRHKVATQRYSIPGHPSLYLGDSIFVCWEELNKPSVREIYASKYVNSAPLNIIEIIRVEDFKLRVNNLEDTALSSEIFRFILTYPLMIACSVKTKFRDGNFKPEYIVPQLFLQFILESKEKVVINEAEGIVKRKAIDGIKYFSTRVSPDKVKNVGTYNYIFPTRSFKQSGLCDVLLEKFEFSEPLYWEYEEIFSKPSGLFNDPGDTTIELNGGRTLPYNWSAFRKIEMVLEEMSTSKLNI